MTSHTAADEHLASLKMPLPSSKPYTPLPVSTSPDAKCSVKLFHTGSLELQVNRFLRLSVPDADMALAPVFSFLIEHTSGRRVVFDLGIKANLENYAPPMQAHLAGRVVHPPRAEMGVMVEESGVPLVGIEAVVRSHTHWDHIGTFATFLPSTTLVLGPGTKKARLPGWPIKDSDINHADIPFVARKVRELDEGGPEAWVDVAAFKGIDWFGDGSLFIVNMPGHMAGHLGALVRTTTSPDTYLLLAGDAAHFRALYTCHDQTSHREPVQLAVWDSAHSPNPRIRERGGLTAIHDELEIAYDTMARLARTEEDENVMVVLAHDIEFERVVKREHPGEVLESLDISDWKARGYKQAVEEEVQNTSKERGLPA